MNRQQHQQQISQTQQSQIQQSQVQQTQQTQQRVVRTEQHVTRQVTGHTTVQGGQVYQQGYQQIAGFGPNAQPPVFEKVFSNARFAQGGVATFEGRVTGKPQPEVTWTRKGAPLLSSSKHRLTYNETTGDITFQINQIGPGDEGEYVCTAKNQYGAAICSVFIQPEGLQMPQRQSFQRHEQVTSYSNGTYVQEDFKIDTFEYRLLREVSFRESITRRFVGESDVHISTTVERSLGPPAPPQISQKPRNSKLLEGSDAVFSAKLSANPRPRITWFRNGQRITEKTQKYETTFSNNQATLRVKQATSEDSGHYTLLAENPQGCVVSSAYLAIEPVTTQEGLIHESTFKTQQTEIDQTDTGKTLAPNFVRVCGDRDVTEGKMTRFDCRVTGRPYPEVTWFINGRQVTDDHNHKILVNESGNHALMITTVSRSDSGVVTCVARNKTGETSFQCNLNVIEKEQVVAPKFVERFTTVNVREGEPVLLNARAVGTPTPRITWQKDGVPLSSSPDVRIAIDGGASTLDIPRAKASDAGWYQCTAQNVAGSTATRARLFVETPQGPSQEPRRLHLPRPTKVIEPEPEPGPEVIYLRHVERARPHEAAPEEDRVYPPPRFIIPLQDAVQFEGGKVHFEARIEPVGDPTMRVEWFINGRPLEASSRATSIFRFGFIALDLISLVIRDSGEYICRVTSATGCVESRAMLSVNPRASIEQTSQHPDSLKYIQQLEDYSKYQRSESLEETINQKPHFIRPLQDLGELQEGRNAHFEAQLTPVSDPTMKVEWYKDGRPITASSRITTIFNFGYVSLNIMHLRAEDAGSYTVRAVNRLGEAISSGTLQVYARSTVTGDLGIPEQQRYIEKVEQLEAYQQQQHQKYVLETPESSQPPEFKTPIKDQIGIREGGFAHFEARLEPVGDSTLKVEWLKDGRPVEASSRITSFFNFGYVALTIKDVTIHDVGNYTCRAYNALGQAVTTAQLSVVSKKDIIFDSQHPGGLEKIQYLEDSSRYQRTMKEETQVTQKPRFLGPLKGTNKIVEGQRAHFEARVEPQSDLTLKIEWYFNGKPIQSANRIQTYHDFGYVALDILSVREEDSGTYTVVARNALGEAQLSASMTVETRASIDTRSMHRSAYDKTQRLEESKFVEPHYDIVETSKSKPIFVVPLSDPQPLSEGRNVHLECRLEPMGDPTMRVEWFCNGRPITVGSRFRTYNDFGFVALDIIHATALDSGEYTVRAVNQLGSAHTSACVRVIEKSDIITDTQHEQSLEQIQMLEDASRYRKHVNEEVTVLQAPQFTRPLHNIETIEGTNVHMECRLQPVGDPTMKVDWFVNGVPVKVGHRFRPAYDFDYVALDLLSVYPSDSGVYTCQARNQLGEAVTSCSVRIIAKKDLLLETQHPAGLEKIQYLEDASRYKRTEFVDEQITVKPRFLSRPKNLEGMIEGQHAHFECKLEPVTDPNLKVEWFKDGRQITVGHRFRPIHDFGYVALDVVDLIAEDSGVYTCRATNLVGVDECSVVLKCRASGQIITSTQNEMGLQQIQHLEDRSKYQRAEQVEERTTQAPIFTTSLKNIEIREGQRAHFECRLIPVSDATMKVEWFHNGQPLKSGSRFTETNNFGFVALDILYAYPEDSGTYTCRATNILGEAVTSAVCNVHSKKSIYSETVHEGAMERIIQLEDTSRYQRQAVQEEVINQAPVFTMPIRDLRVAENQAAHFEARLIPVGDSRLKVEWLRNGVPIQASNRITTMHDFGYVALNMKYVNPEDSGSYTCRAVNDLGEAVTSATLFVQSKASLQLETQHEGALQKLRQLEDSTKYQRREEEEVLVTQAPKFSTQLNGPTELVEGQSAHYECRIEPYPDSTMKVEWLHNGKPLSTGHRFRTAYDFGFASLDVLTVYAEDSGEYTCRVTNRLGQAQSSVVTNVKSKSSIIRETQHEGALQKIQYLEDDSRYKKVAQEDALILEKPQFGRGLKTIENLPEGSSAHLEATLTPVNDPTMRVEWYCNGRPIQTGHRFKTTYDFGFVALDILYAYAEDSGTYMCKARNAVGEAVTTANVQVIAKSGLYLDTMDEQRLKKIRDLESYERPKKEEVEVAPQRPVFLTPLVSLENLKEGEHAHLECRVEPVNDPNLKIEWFVNGVKLRAGHRFRTTHDFGYVALDVLYTYPEDSGTYMCKATNLVGEAVNTCTIKVGGRKSILLETQHPEGLEKIRELEAQGRPTRLEVEEPIPTPPRIVTELRGTTEIYEGQTAHFEAQVEPIHDPNLRIEFYHNGKPLPSASRFHITFDFGYIALDIGHAVPEDAGEYTVKAINNLGQCTSSINLKVIAKSNIILESQRPEGLDKIKQLEEHVPYKRPEIDEPVTRQRPVFTQPLQNIDSIVEGQTAHFECRLIPVGDPTLKVEWFRNEKPLEDSSRITKVHDFGFVSLDISHVRDEDEGVYICRASNPLGEAVTTASMKIRTKASIQLETQHPEAQRKIAQLEQPMAPRPEEPERYFEKPIFTQILTGPTELWEGQHAHFEARVVPVGDPDLRFEWYVNGVELKLGSRFKVTHDFGFVTLDIMSTVPEDSGVYMCKAINKSGEAVSSISMKVKSKSNIVGDTLQPDAWQKIQLKEAEMNKVPEMFVDTTPQQPPVFTTHLQSYDKLVEGQHVYLEAQVEPRADPNLRIEWFKNGISLTTGTRLRSTFDFGLVTLSINSLRADDSAIYTCKATNLLGEAISTCTLKIEDRHWLLGQTLHPDAIPKLEALERPQEPRAEMAEPTYELPVFITHLNNVECMEGDNVHFECNVEPSKDPTLKIEWFVNGKALPSGTKYKSTYDFGYVALDMTHVYEHDAGIYTCKATNSKGSATTSGSLRVTSKTDIYRETQHPQGKAGLEAVQDVEEAFAAKYQRQSSAPEQEFGKPIWTTPLNPEFRLVEGQPLHLEGTVEPKNDPNLKIEWFFNGKSLDHGTRFKLTSDFGFVTLDLTDVYERDQGIYTCKASNKSGEAFTSTTIYCTSKANLIERTQHPKGQEGLEKIQDLEDSLNRPEAQIPEVDEGHAPVFTSEFTHLTNLSEGEIAHFEAGLTPIGDQTMVVEWFYNGKTIEASHRFRTVHAFGMVVLEVLGCKIEDSGTYTCRATNKWGKAEQSVTLECTEKIKGQKPRFTTHIKDIVGLKDGQSAHFECTLVPVNDPDLKVEWYHNGQQILQSSRIKTVSDFGFVVMDISYIQDHDSGEYVCRAYNKYGEDFTKATISAHGKGGVFSETLQPDSLAKIRELESLQGQQVQAPTTPVTEAPKFVTQIQDITKLVEGQSAHFEARLTPVTDPDLVVEWYYNGKKLPHGHRYRTFHDFGIVILDILYCYEENSGTYECRAYNKYGEDTTKATLKCVSKANLILESQLPRGMEGGLEKIQTLEDSLTRTRDEKVTEEKGRAPVFTVPLSNIDSLREGESAHFEARLIPTDDPKLKVEWFWNGKPLRTGSRFRTFCDFGFVILEISPVYPEDSGEYSCRAFNEYGEAVTTASMKVQGKRSIILESQLPKGMEGTIDKIAELEGLGIVPSQATVDDDSGKPPEFITTPSDLMLSENSLAHFECKLVPVNDQSMRVEWFHNGKALWAGSRIKTINDFGFVILEISGIYQRDSGLYTCKATNKHGEATVSCKLQVRGRQGIILEPQLPSDFRSGTESIQRLEETLYKKEEITTEEEKPNPPRFIVEIKDNLDVPEGGPVHFDCRVEPTNDSTMRIDWFHNGRPFATGSRVHQINDFGFISLDIDYTYARDAGEYVCRATNKWGSATTKATVTSKSKRTIDYESQLPAGMSAEKLKELERGKVEAKTQEEKTYSPPKFITHIESTTIEESESVHFECRVEPKDDPRLRIEWYRNGKPLPSGHRYRTVYDMGFVSLDILYVYEEDSGEYVCRAVNEHGEDFTKAKVTCKKLPNIILQNQVPKGMKKSETLMQMEAAIKKYTSEIHLTEDDLYDADKKQPPRFVTQIQSQETLVEMQTTKFECQLAPVGDPNMKVEWFFNGKPLPHKNRFTPIYDFGYVAMNFGWVYPEDSGEYVCRATNLYGMDETRAIIKTAGKPGIIYDSQLPKGMKSIEKIRELEAAWQVVPEEAVEESKPRSAPVFVSKPEPCTVQEGEWARFCCRVTGHPRPRVMWLINGHTVVNGSRYKLTYDGMYHMDIPKTRQYDTGKVEVIARSSVGEAIAQTELKVVPRQDDYRGVLKNSPRPWYDLELAQYQKERTETELERVFDERNTLQREQGLNISAIHVQPKEIKEEQTEWQKNVKTKKTEDYYSKIHELENEQVTKEIKLRESSHQYAIPGEKIVSSSLAKGMAQQYQQNLEQKPERVDLKPIPHIPKAEQQQMVHRDQVQLKKTDKSKEMKEQREVIIDSKKGAYPPEPTESSVHGREVYVTKQKQVQKEKAGDTEITRTVTATETTDVEHKAKTQERVVQGQVLPSNPPVFTKKIQPCLAFENTSARFEVEFDGDPLPKITWYRENFPITSSPDLTIYTFSTKSILVLRQVFMEDSGVFSVVAENRGGTAKCSANLVVQERRSQARGGIIPPSFVTTIQSTTVNVGQLVRFDARINGTKPMDVYWLKNGKKITSDIRYKTLEEDEVHTLLIIEVVPEDSGKYECVAINSAGEARCEAECVVQRPVTPSKPQKPTTPTTEKAPNVLEPLKDQKVREGQAVAFKCKITAKPEPTIKWQKGDKIIKPSKYFQMVKDGDNYTLKISEAFPEDEGVYKCVATNPAGTVTTQANLKVLAPETQEVAPSLTPMKDVIVPEGSPAQFKTTVSGKPRPTIQWLREGFLIPDSPDFQMIHEGNNAVLLISTTYEEDSGTFTCRATSSAGQVERSAKLIVKSRPGTYRKTATTDLTKDGQKMIKPGQVGPGPGGPGKTSQKFVPGSKGGVQPADENELPVGDEMLPWRRKPKPQQVVGVEEQKPQQAQSWTQEQIKLKQTQIKRKEVVKEQIEEVQLKPSKTQSREVSKPELEKVDLKHRTKVTFDQKTEQVTTRDERVNLEDTTLLKVDKRTTVEKTDKIQTKDWHQQTRHVEDSTLLSVDEQEQIRETKEAEVRGWRRGRKEDTNLERQRHLEDTTLLDKQEIEETEKIKQIKETETKGWRKSRKDETSRDRKKHVEDTTLLDRRETEETKTKQIKEDEVRGWRRPRKDDISLDRQKHVEDITLLDRKETEESEKTKEIKETEVRGWRRPRKDDTSLDRQKYIEDTTLIDRQETEERLEAQDWRRPKPSDKPRRSIDIIDEKTRKEEPVPWTKEEIKLKPAPKERKDIPKEKPEEVQLKPTRPEAKIVPKEDLEKVDLKPFQKKPTSTEIDRLDKAHVDQADILPVDKGKTLEEIKPEDKKPEEVKPEQIKLKTIEKKEEPVPWFKEPRALKKTPKEHKEVPKEKPEEVQLKPTRPEAKVIPKEEIEKVDLKPFQKKPTSTEIDRLDKGHVDQADTLQVDKLKTLEEIKQEEVKPEQTKLKTIEKKEEPVPWFKEPIALKKTPKEPKEVPKEKPEEIQLKPVRRESKTIPKEELQPVELKPVLLQKMKPTESDQFERVHVEDTTLLKVDEKTDETKEVKSKSWRKRREETEEKLEDIEDKKIREEGEKPKLPKQEEIPWNKQEIKLKPTPKEKKDVSKEKVEEGLLMSRESSAIQKEEAEILELKPVATDVTKIIKKDDDKIKVSATEDTTTLHIKEKIDQAEIKKPKTEETRGWRKPRKPEDTSDAKTLVDEKPTKIEEQSKQPNVPEKKEEIPWTQEAISLKPTHKEKKEIPQEQLEQVSLKPFKKTVKEDIKTSEIEETKKEEIPAKSWRKPRKEDEKPRKEEIIHVEDKTTIDQKEEVKKEVVPKSVEEEKPTEELSPWRKPKQVPVKKPEEEVIPWQQGVALKPTKLEKRPIEKEKLEEVNLKPFATKAEPTITDHAIEEKTVLAEVKSTEPVKPKRPEQQEPEIVKPKMEEVESKKIQKKPKEKPKFTKEESVVVEVPWKEIQLKRTPKVQKAVVQEEMETVTLKPIPKPVEEPKEADIESSSEEDIQLIPIDKQKPSETKKPKRRRKPKGVAPEDEEKPEEVQPKEIKPAEVPETVILETITDVEDTVVLKVDDTKKDKPRKIRQEVKEEVPEIVKLRPAKRTEQPKEEEELEKVTLKPVRKFKPETADISTIEKKPRRKVYKDVELPEDGERYVPEEAEKIEFEDKPKEVEEKPSAPWRREVKPKPEVQEEEKSPLKIGKGKIPREEEDREQVSLKPIKKEKPHEEKPSDVSKPIKLEDTKFIPSDLENQKFEPTPKEPKEKDKVEKPEKQISEEKPSKPVVEETVTAPWRRQPKQKVDEVPQEKEWPKGKRRPPEEEKQEPIKLKPFKKEKPEEPLTKVEIETVKFEEPVVTVIEERDDSLKFKPFDHDEKPEEEKEIGKRIRKKPKEKSEKPEDVVLQPEEKVLEEVVEEIPKKIDQAKVEPKEEQAPEVKTWRRGKTLPKPEEEKKEVVTLKPVPRKEEVTKPEEPQQSEITVSKIKTSKKIRVSKSHALPKEGEETEVISEEEKPELVPVKVEDVTEVIQDRVTTQQSVAQITLAERKVEKRVEEKQETVIEEEELPFQKEMNVAIVSKKKTSERRVIHFDDYGRPIPELEIISQKRSTEVTDKVPEEPLQEDIDIREQKTVHKTITISERVKGKTVAPKFTKRVEPVVAEPEKPTRLVCKVEGTPFPEIAWYKNEVLMHATERVYWNIVENTVTLEFATVEPQDVAIYSCRATNPAGVASSTANLVILEKEESGIAPHFVQPLKPQIVEEKSKAVLRCQVAGKPTPNVQWFKDNKELVPTPLQQTTYNPETGIATLELFEATIADEKVYTVKADNKFGQAECRANLVVSKAVTVTQPLVMQAPRIIKPVKAVVAKPDEEIVLDAEFKGIPAPEIKWMKNNKEIKEGDEYEIKVQENKTVLKIKKKVKKKGGKYEVQAVNPKGEVRTSGTVTITQVLTEEAQPPKFLKPIQPQYATVGEVVILEAEVESLPAASFQWFQKLTPIISTPEMKIVSEENRSTLIMTDVTPEQAGSITCRAENAVGSVTCTATLNVVEETEWEETRVLEYPRFIKPLIPIRVMDGEKVQFTCVVTGKPTPKVQWYHNDLPVKEAKDVVISQTTEGVCQLAISEVFPENAGVYTCKAMNKVGEAVCKSSLIVEAYEYVPDSEMGHMTGSEEDLLADRTISEGVLSDSDTECAPKIIKKLPQVISTKDGDVTRLEVKAVGKPKPEGKWLKQGTEIIPSADFLIENFEDGTSILTISEVYPDDTGDIIYEAQNPLGVAVTTTQLLVESTEGILGTKEYRKPEWVTHMEELQASLKGKNVVQVASMSHAHSFDISTDSLEVPCTLPSRKNDCGGKRYAEEDGSTSKPFYLNEHMESQASSSASVYSEPNHITKTKMSFIESAMADYLNSHRHSLSSVMELIDKSERSKKLTDESVEEIKDIPVDDDPEEYEEIEIMEEDPQSRHSSQPFYILSPIEEKSEPSTRSSSFRGSNGSEKRRMAVHDNRQKLSSSCDPIPSERVGYEYMQEKYQTFPRIKNETDNQNLYKNYYNEETMYPLEPRELDPCAFQQLHTADSQEELQEFLLLESECMSDRGRGLASAFVESSENIPENFNYSKDQ